MLRPGFAVFCVAGISLVLLGSVLGGKLHGFAARSNTVRHTADEPTVEFRALFMATVDNIDWPASSADSVASQQAQLLAYLDMMRDTNMNAVMMQVRTSGDALYDSPIEPWSKYMTGQQGTPPSPLWDPLAFAIREGHLRGIQVHAWLNPYRANLSPNWNGLDPSHMAMVYREYAYPYSTYLWMDPGADVVINRLVDVVEDIITRYEVDGVHFDDYFYPYPDGTAFPDDVTYDRYVQAGGNLSRDDWRRQNVDLMIERVFRMVKETRPQVKFSISPFGLYRPGHPEGMPPPITGFDPYSEIYADAKKWLQSGWMDFIAPQLYWSINSTGQSYPVLLDWWLDNNPLGLGVYAANGVYRILPPSSWPVSEIVQQVDISRDPARRDAMSLGNILFSAKYYRDNTSGITDTFRTQVYTMQATVPN